MDNANLQNHQQKRKEIFNKLPEFWADLQDSYYALLDYYPFTKKQVDEIHLITEQIGKIYDKTASLMRQLPDDIFYMLGYSKEIVPYLRHKTIESEGIIRRIDLVCTEFGWKHYECNSDTPTFIMETHHVNGFITDYFNLKNPNEQSELKLSKVINQIVNKSIKGLDQPIIVFTAHGGHEEDWKTTKYIQSLYEGKSQLIPLEELQIVENDGLYTPKGERIHILYRQTYPIEQLELDQSPDGTKIGLSLLELVKSGKLIIFNPLSSFLLQSKAVQALIWNLHLEKSDVYTSKEHDMIRKYFLPTFLEPDYFIENKLPYVEKPAFGREGDSIKIINDGIYQQSKENNYRDQVMVYQQFAPLPKRKVMTPEGMLDLHILVGSFLIKEEYGAIGVRAGNIITGNESCFLPVGIVDDEK
ncbi:glutathionylspermidine synthase family protein [Gottfriedia luciferensis]|uniref:glutathionylspermidine synthase family protein n=1 Tax=Gottfriedia luciferensis TaxID=178774 RepID=UPI000B44E034|nr:glutathionylspermidine synthase family protein [Gottfriedia luciferensis]